MFYSSIAQHIVAQHTLNVMEGGGKVRIRGVGLHEMYSFSEQGSHLGPRGHSVPVRHLRHISVLDSAYYY